MPDGIRIFIVSHGESGDLRFRVKQALLDGLYPAKPATVPAVDAKNAPALTVTRGTGLPRSPGAHGEWRIGCREIAAPDTSY